MRRNLLLLLLILFSVKAISQVSEVEKLVKEIAEDKGEDILRKDERDVLIENITWKYLDFICFSDADMKKITSLSGIFRYLAGHGFDMDHLYRGWDGATVKSLNPSVKIKKIQEAIRGK